MILPKHWRLYLRKECQRPFCRDNQISRLKQCGVNEYDDWRTRDLSKERYVYIWADGIYFNISSDDAKQCILVIIGVASRGNIELLAIEEGYRESEQSWTEVLLNLKGREFRPPQLAAGDGYVGFLEGRKKSLWPNP